MSIHMPPRVSLSCADVEGAGLLDEDGRRDGLEVGIGALRRSQAPLRQEQLGGDDEVVPQRDRRLIEMTSDELATDSQVSRSIDDGPENLLCQSDHAYGMKRTLPCLIAAWTCSRRASVAGDSPRAGCGGVSFSAASRTNVCWSGKAFGKSLAAMSRPHSASAFDVHQYWWIAEKTPMSSAARTTAPNVGGFRTSNAPSQGRLAC